jgi:hypothetical protein
LGTSRTASRRPCAPSRACRPSASRTSSSVTLPSSLATPTPRCVRSVARRRRRCRAMGDESGQALADSSRVNCRSALSALRCRLGSPGLTPPLCASAPAAPALPLRGFAASLRPRLLTPDLQVQEPRLPAPHLLPLLPVVQGAQPQVRAPRLRRAHGAHQACLVRRLVSSVVGGELTTAPDTTFSWLPCLPVPPS